MHFIVSSGALLKNLQMISGIINPNSVLPILENFLLDISNNQLKITAADMETMIQVQMDVQVSETSSQDNIKICIPANLIINYLKNLSEQPINFIINPEDYSFEISSSTGKYKIGGENGMEYPKWPMLSENVERFEMNSIHLIEAINKTLFATSTDNLRPAMTGVYFEFEENGLTFVSTDAHRMVKFSRSDISCPDEGGIIIPKKPLTQLKNMLPTDETPIKISFNESHLYVENDSIKLNCRLIDGKFPPYKAVIPQDNPYVLIINRAELISGLRRVSVFANKSTHQVLFDIIGNSLSISAQDLDFSYEGRETLNVQYSGEDMKIAFNSKLLIEMMNNFDGEEVKLELSMPSKAGVFRATEEVENEDFLMLLMPLIVGV